VTELRHQNGLTASFCAWTRISACGHLCRHDSDRQGWAVARPILRAKPYIAAQAPGYVDDQDYGCPAVGIAAAHHRQGGPVEFARGLFEARSAVDDRTWARYSARARPEEQPDHQMMLKRLGRPCRGRKTVGQTLDRTSTGLGGLGLTAVL
jgi:hypothetical protein